MLQNPLRTYRMNQNNRTEYRMLPRIPGLLELDKHSFASTEVQVKCFREPHVVRVGKYCSIGKATFIIDGNHNPYYASTFPFKEWWYNNKAPENRLDKIVPKVGNDVWIGDDVYIYSGVTIHDGAVIGGNSVVTQDVPPYSIVCGNPAQIVKKRFDDDLIKRYLRVKWWDLQDKVVANDLAPLLDKPKRFVEKVEEILNLNCF